MTILLPALSKFIKTPPVHPVEPTKLSLTKSKSLRLTTIGKFEELKMFMLVVYNITILIHEWVDIMLKYALLQNIIIGIYFRVSFP